MLVAIMMTNSLTCFFIVPCLSSRPDLLHTSLSYDKISALAPRVGGEGAEDSSLQRKLDNSLTGIIFISFVVKIFFLYSFFFKVKETP